MDSKNLLIIVVVIVVVIILFAIAQPTQVSSVENFGNYGYPLESNQSYLLNNDQLREGSLLNAKCSRDCCRPQWPTPFDSTHHQEINKDNYILNQYMCNSQGGNGCVCLDKPTANFLYSRGNNA